MGILEFTIMRKVFRHFSKIVFVNKKLVIPIGLGVIMVIIGIIATSDQDSNQINSEDNMDLDFRPQEEITPEIQERLDEIEKIKLENEYEPKERVWQTSGPFQIDRSEYLTGEKIFLRIGGLGLEEKGQIVFLKPLNITHYEVYLSIPFDGSDTESFNYYLQPSLSKFKDICTVDDLLGEWRVVFKGTDYPNLEFRIIEDIIPGDEKYYEPVC